ncbi:16S rRNA (adenine1518-N6/adenine1519-N6)-dimethyltransferase [Cyclobacterium lianum]|uniref:Ribosomal RNA small subunit methyltransferase A n=1 Tax=Cyclobacterium lianum TaxID=388280 RepID=A0A1M7IU86_9BACT|nr:16S rRNA (adenine(1518)-N(6)/adenine(1519)-N(6))-dimethyltransferase RsmA [Cyclobacterium lianum]SHM43877.1 16S rRNA (adenine1518-N6/adenine1519-N6)-dimethyltransferase [Cyclobacterium lianum]
MRKVRAKKHLGQHFLTDLQVAERIAGSLSGHRQIKKVLEIGPGMGVLTDFLARQDWELYLIEIDEEAVDYLLSKYADPAIKVIKGDFLDRRFRTLIDEPYAIIGNFPYNISSQIFFRVLEERQQVTEIVGMLQKEVAERIAAKKGSKTYGILSVLLQAYYEVSYLFDVPPEVFDPPPKVNSGVIQLKRNDTYQLDCDEKLFFRLVKQAFNTRRKTLRNALKPMGLSDAFKNEPLLDLRAEQLGVAEFVYLTRQLEISWKE